LSWFTIRRNGDEALISICGEINPWVKPADDLIQQLDGVTRADLFIDSFGGCSVEALKLHAAFARINVDVTVRTCASCATTIALSARTIRIAHDGRIMIHAPVAFVAGPVGELRRTADHLSSVTARIAEIICARTRQPRETVDKWLAGEKDFWFSASEALSAGLADSIVTTMIKTPDAAPAESESTQHKPNGPTPAEKGFLKLIAAYGSFAVRDRQAFNRNVEILLRNVHVQ
jgi:ATP-dependent protease ClpP protease subunit